MNFSVYDLSPNQEQLLLNQGMKDLARERFGCRFRLLWSNSILEMPLTTQRHTQQKNLKKKLSSGFSTTSHSEIVISKLSSIAVVPLSLNHVSLQ